MTNVMAPIRTFQERTLSLMGSVLDTNEFKTIPDAKMNSITANESGKKPASGARTDPNGSFDASHIGHEDVHRYQVRLELAEFVDRFDPGLCFTDDLETGLGEQVGKQ